MNQPKTLSEYLEMQRELIFRCIGRGGSAEGWIARHAATFRRRYGSALPTPCNADG
jgi:hypothetical protein